MMLILYWHSLASVNYILLLLSRDQVFAIIIVWLATQKPSFHYGIAIADCDTNSIRFFHIHGQHHLSCDCMSREIEA